MNRLRHAHAYLAAFVLLPTTSVSLRLLGLKRTCQLLGVPIRTHQVTGPKPPNTNGLAFTNGSTFAETIYRVVHRVARQLPIQPQCLPRSIVICRLLRNETDLGGLRISIKRNSRDLEAHAWVEFAQRVLGEADPANAGLQAF